MDGAKVGFLLQAVCAVFITRPWWLHCRADYAASKVSQANVFTYLLQRAFFRCERFLPPAYKTELRSGGEGITTKQFIYRVQCKLSIMQAQDFKIPLYLCTFNERYQLFQEVSSSRHTHLPGNYQ